MVKIRKEKIFLLQLLIFSSFFLPESFGLGWGRVLSVSLTGLTAVFFLYKNLGRNILNQKIISYLLVTAFLIIFSTIWSVRLEMSLISTAELIILTGITIIAGMYYREIIKVASRMLIISGTILCFYSVVINLLFPSDLIPADGYQLVFSRFGSHNHLGDFLVLPMFVSFYNILKKRKKGYLFALLFFFPFFIFSYSRSAYMTFTITACIFLLRWFLIGGNKLRKFIPAVFALLGITVIILFFMITVFESGKIPLLNPLHQQLVSRYGLRFKHFGANRPEYIKTAIKSIEEKPFFGVGPGNFRYASIKYSSIPNYSTHSSHNIFLDVLTEYGFPVFLIFSALVLFIIRKSLQTPSLYSYLYLALLINFQTDYTFRIFSIAVLFCIFTATIFRIKKNEV